MTTPAAELRGKFPVQLRSRVSPEQFETIREDAGRAGMSVCRFVRERALSHRVVSNVDMQLYGKLITIGNLLKYVAAMGQDTSQTQKELRETLKALRQ